MAVTQTLIDHTMQSKAMVAACSTAVLARLSEESKQHIQAFLSKRKKTARTSNNSSSSSSSVNNRSRIWSSSRQDKQSR